MMAIDASRIIRAEARQTARLAARRQELAALRLRREEGGLTLSPGVVIRTTREGQAQLASVVVSLEQGFVTAPMPWKFEGDVWSDVSAEQIAATAAAVARHVAGCFAAERVVAAALVENINTDIEAAFDAAYAAAMRG